MQRLNDYLYQLTLLLKSTPSDNYSARSISQALQLNRSTISSYLNEGVREGLFIKVKVTRFYFYIEQLLKNYISH